MSDLWASGWPWAVACVLGLAWTLAGESRQRIGWTAAGKLVAASAYLGAALAWGAGENAHGRMLLAGMVCCWLGDLLLVSRDTRRLFLAGLAAFLFGHLAYSAAFYLRGQAFHGWAPALVVMLVFLAMVLRWLWPHLGARMRGPVVLYMVAITLMMVLAVGSHAHADGPLLLWGAALFVVSDLAVARHRFVKPAFANRAVGLPVYFLAQMLLAAGASR